MKKPLHVLQLENGQNSADLARTNLEKGGIECRVESVKTKADFVAALERGDVDLVLSDCSLAGFDNLSALEITRARWPALPFIIVAGTDGEELAVDALKRGATDYLLKKDLHRLAPAVVRAMEEAKVRMEHQRLGEQFLEAQKMEVIGQLASGVAHDFNNILAVIIGYSDLMKEEVGTESVCSKYIQEIRHAAEHASALTRQLLVFSRKHEIKPVVLDLNDVLKELDKMLHRLIDEHVELDLDLEKKNGRIKADPAQIGQVLMNLVVNARDAMPNGGRLIIATRNVTVDENYSGNGTKLTPGQYVMLSISDTGCGMTDETRAHLFEAFFTTKPKGKGTGLGLVTCQTIVKQSGGYILVRSELNKGTTFEVYFPQVAQPLETTTQSAGTGPLPRGTETLLVVEDEPVVRKLARNVLAMQGYDVLAAADGQEGLRVAREHKGPPIRLVIADVVMPHMGGKMMAEWLKSSYPDLKVLFTSGYTDDAIVHHGVLQPSVAFLAKPYNPATLARKVREILDTP
jgi:two-component system cell cycle sensor histidine kinase/response regulator CckA